MEWYRKTKLGKNLRIVDNSSPFTHYQSLTLKKNLLMNVLVLGSGGREHAISWKIAQSSQIDKLFIAPGNAGTNQVGVNVDIQVDDFKAIKKFCLEEKIEYLVVGPEKPLVDGIADFFLSDPEINHIAVIGPNKKAAHPYALNECSVMRPLANRQGTFRRCS